MEEGIGKGRSRAIAPAMRSGKMVRVAGIETGIVPAETLRQHPAG